ncbi:hypothetical protein KBB68_04220 [Candidatus Babeliales bacterium]|nr:hypothetical protein [Candidatus Babeliales bacterium]
MVFKTVLRLIFLFCCSSIVQPVEPERPMSSSEVEKSLNLYMLMKYARHDNDQKKLAQQVSKLLAQGALFNIFFENNSTALSLAQQKNFKIILELLKEDSLQNVWDELRKKGILKSHL